MDLNLTTYEQDMLTTYQREKVIEPYQRLATPFINGMKEVGQKGMKLLGNVLEFSLRLHAGFGVGTPNDGGDWTQARTHRSIKAQVTRAMLDSSLKITVETEAAAEGGGSFTGDALADAVKNCIDVFYWHKNVLSLGHGTGRLAVVAADSPATDTVVMDAPEFCFALRIGLFVEFADIDSGGTVQNLGASGLETQVEDIDWITHTVTFTDSITVSAGWGIYVAGTYGKRKPNGLRTFIDNGALTTTVMNINRAANPQVNATIIDPGVLQDYTESGVRDLLVQIKQKSGMVPTEFWSNAGVIAEHFAFTQPDRQFVIQGTAKDVPSYNIGGNEEDIAFHHGGRRIPYKCDMDLPARGLYASYGPGWRSHTLIEDDWLKGPKGILHQAPAVAGGTYSNNNIGEMQGCSNVSHKNLNAQGAWLNIRDRVSARD